MSANSAAPNEYPTSEFSLRLELAESKYDLAVAKGRTAEALRLRVPLIEARIEEARGKGDKEKELRHRLELANAKMAVATDAKDDAAVKEIRVELAEAKIALADALFAPSAQEAAASGSTTEATADPFSAPASAAGEQTADVAEEDAVRGDLLGHAPASPGAAQLGAAPTSGADEENDVSGSPSKGEPALAAAAMEESEEEDDAAPSPAKTSSKAQATAIIDSDDSDDAPPAAKTSSRAQATAIVDSDASDSDASDDAPPVHAKKAQKARVTEVGDSDEDQDAPQARTKRSDKASGHTIELTDDEEGGVKVAKKGSAAAADSDDEVDELNSEVGKVPQDAPAGKDEDYAGQLTKWTGWAWAYAGWWGKTERDAVELMLEPLISIEFMSGFQQGTSLPSALPYMNAWCSKRRMPCKMDQTTAYTNKAKKESYTPHFELKVVLLLAVLRKKRFEDLVNICGRHGFVSLVRGVMQARAVGAIVEDFECFAQEIGLTLSAIRLYWLNNEHDMEANTTLLDVLTKTNAALTEKVTQALKRRREELEALESPARTSTPSPKKVKKEKRVRPSTPAPTPVKKEKQPTPSASKSSRKRSGEGVASTSSSPTKRRRDA